MERRLNMSAESLHAFCLKHRIRKLAMFGSEMDGRATPTSDVDLLVEFEDGLEPGFLALAGMEIELSDLLGGRKVDLRTPQDLSRYFRDDVVRRAEVQFAR
jgi:uncharacterized protein